jgi:hypothetical protein
VEANRGKREGVADVRRQPHAETGNRYDLLTARAGRTSTIDNGESGMQRFRTIVPLIIAIAGCATGASTQTGVPRIASQVDMPLRPVASGSQGASWTFNARGIRGTVQASGSWNISAEVRHDRLRCATYETGIRLGQGDASCKEVAWLTDVQFGTRMTQCNGATLIHSGGGKLNQGPAGVDSANCVGVVVRCTGAC